MRCLKIVSIFLGCMLLSTVTFGLSWGREFCDPNVKRGLVLSGGGTKGAYEAGAAYHMIVHRKCNFKDFSGVSAGALNASFLAQAGPSHSDLVAQAEDLATLYKSMTTNEAFMTKKVPEWFLGDVGTLIGLAFGSESVNDFGRLEDLIRKKIDPDKLVSNYKNATRKVRVGVSSFYDGRYKEEVPKTYESNPTEFLKYIYASAAIPVYAEMPRIRESNEQSGDNETWGQFGDGGLRHTTPITGYFRPCNMKLLVASKSDSGANICNRNIAPEIPEHDELQELMVVITSPHKAETDLIDPPDQLPKGNRHVTGAMKIIKRTLDIVLSAPYRWDVNFMLIANDMLRWRKTQSDLINSLAKTDEAKDLLRRFDGDNDFFPIDSYNPWPGDESRSLPYRIGLVAPKTVLTPGTYDLNEQLVKDMLLRGCLRANDSMQKDFGLTTDMAPQCNERFPGGTPEQN